MNLKFDVNAVLFGYLFICVVLMIFNVVYIFYSQEMKKRLEHDIVFWKNNISVQLRYICEGKGISRGHSELMEKRLDHTSQLTAYSRALDELRNDGAELEEYLEKCYMIFQGLAVKYARKESLDRAFFAHFAAVNIQTFGDEYRAIIEIFLAYVDNSTVYCRENVLKAFYKFGNIRAVENILKIIESRGLFHHQKLLADGLMSFQGDKEALAELLWKERGEFSVSTNIAIIQFISACSPNFAQRFCEEIKNSKADVEMKLAMLRYFQRNFYAPVKPMLIEYLRVSEEKGYNFAIVAAAVLAKYPGDDTAGALKKALTHSNWYVRRNAAISLVTLAEDKSELESILAGDDRYAKEMLEYMMTSAEKKGKSW
ncbi:MAG: HEAT repeat domain-containing protein [Anaerovoracaceae bacterium]